MSEWKEGAAKRRDARHTKSEGPGKGGPVAKAKKDTKRWCRGKIGVEHKPECRDYREVKGVSTAGDRAWVSRAYDGWKLLICIACGKELASYHSRYTSPRPAWVTP